MPKKRTSVGQAIPDEVGCQALESIAFNELDAKVNQWMTTQISVQVRKEQSGTTTNDLKSRNCNGCPNSCTAVCMGSARFR